MKARDLIKKIGKTSMEVLDDVSDIQEFYDTGTYMLNALVSASIFGGIPGNRITAFAGEPSTGKSYLIMEILKYFKRNVNDGLIYYADTEGASTKELFASRGINFEDVIYTEPETVEHFRSELFNLVSEYSKEENRPKLIAALDSIGNMSSIKEMTDIENEENKVDMTRAKALAAAFRVLAIKLKKANVPLIVANHIYESMDIFKSTPKMKGGNALVYSATTIVYLTKKKDKDNVGEGVLIGAKTQKSRASREFATVDLRLSYKTGLDRYYGLLDFAEKTNIIPRIGNRYEMPDGSKHFKKEIETTPERYFTDDILNRIEIGVKDYFAYGSTTEYENELSSIES